MTIFNVKAKLNKEHKERLETNNNSFGALKNKTFGRIKNLMNRIVESPKAIYTSTIKVKGKYDERLKYGKTAKMSKLERRTFGELEGLKFSVIELPTKDKNIIARGLRMIRPHKTYKNKLNVIRKYTNKLKY